jgi:DNA-directed RNA polymerase subunit RPC12/RpoP
MTIADSLRDAIEHNQLPPATAPSVLRELLDIPTLNKRRCFECGQSNWHADAKTPYVLCRNCGSQDTRLIKVEP